jgi:hypothetical protein
MDAEKLSLWEISAEKALEDKVTMEMARTADRAWETRVVLVGIVLSLECLCELSVTASYHYEIKQVSCGLLSRLSHMPCIITYRKTFQIQHAGE